jgi:vacuolar-type H+-ATPase subunit I/STV1
MSFQSFTVRIAEEFLQNANEGAHLACMNGLFSKVDEDGACVVVINSDEDAKMMARLLDTYELHIDDFPELAASLKVYETEAAKLYADKYPVTAEAREQMDEYGIHIDSDISRLFAILEKVERIESLEDERTLPQGVSLKKYARVVVDLAFRLTGN